jgi:hypothetical protein
MMWIALLIALVLSLGALAYVVWPLLKPGPAPILVEDDRLTELLGRKDAVLKAIKDLEFDYQVGKLSEEDYQLYDQRLRRQAVGLLQQIEQVAPLSAGLDNALEQEILRRRRVADAPAAAAGAAGTKLPAVAPVRAAPVPVSAGPVSVAATAAPVAVAEMVTGPVTGPVSDPQGMEGINGGGTLRFCTNCGHKLEAQHKFCANCGTPATL